jgi:hypothetical protein
MGLVYTAAVGLLIGYHPPEPEYVFVPDTTRWVMIERWVGKEPRTVLLRGKLDAEGNFVQHAKYESIILSCPPGCTLINSPGDSPKPVYEFRSGRLIKGQLMPDGNFVPDVGSTVIHFQDYRYSPDAIPIWNLPGYFKKKADMK